MISWSFAGGVISFSKYWVASGPSVSSLGQTPGLAVVPAHYSQRDEWRGRHSADGWCRHHLWIDADTTIELLSTGPFCGQTAGQIAHQGYVRFARFGLATSFEAAWPYLRSGRTVARHCRSGSLSLGAVRRTKFSRLGIDYALLAETADAHDAEAAELPPEISSATAKERSQVGSQGGVVQRQG